MEETKTPDLNVENLPSPSTSASQPSQAVPPHKKSKLIYLFIGLVILVIITFTASVAANIYKGTQPKPTPTPLAQKPTPTPPPAGGPTASWKTFSNTTCGYSIKYPPNMETFFLPDVGGGNPSTSFESGSDNFSSKTGDGVSILYLNIHMSEVSDASSFESIRNYYNNEKSYTNLRFEDISVDGVKALRVTGDLFGKPFLEEDLTNKGCAYKISSDKDSIEMAKQILSTFKFTDSADTSIWKTYIGDGFTFKYPDAFSHANCPASFDATALCSEKQTGGTDPVYYYISSSVESSLPQKYKYESIKVNEVSGFKTLDVPSRSGTESIFIKNNENSYLDIFFTPFDKDAPFPNQDKFQTIFSQILSTFKFTK